MKEQLERDIEILRKAKHISVNNYDFHCGVKIKALETKLTEKLKSLDTKEQQDTDLLKESIDLVSKAEELAFKTSITDRQSLSNQFFRLKNRLGALKHKGKVKEVTIWDVIEECKGVTGKGEMTAILDKYEMKYARQYDWRPLSKNVHILDQPLNFTAKGHQLRLKEQK